MRRRIYFLGGLVSVSAAILAAVAVGAPAESYDTLRSAPEQLAHSISGASSTDFSAPIGNVAGVTSNARVLNGNPTVAVNVAFSGSSGDTCVMRCVLWEKTGTTWTMAGLFDATATAGDGTNATSDNVAQTLLFDSAGAEFYEIRNKAPSAGLVRYSAHAYGARSQ